MTNHKLGLCRMGVEKFQQRVALNRRKSDDVAGESKALVDRGWKILMAQAPPEKNYGAFTYVQPPSGLIVELVWSAIKPMFDMGWAQFNERYAHRVSARTLRWAEQFSNRIPQLLERYLSEPNTLVHGDFRLDNMFFDADGNAGGSFALVDWQMAMRSPGGSDLVYFIVTNLAPETRRAMERELVERYQAGLARQGVTGEYATVQRLWQGYIEGILFYCVSFGGGLLTIDPANERGVKLFDELVMRTYIAAEDLAVGDILGLD